jgi:hypothetical protein
MWFAIGFIAGAIAVIYIVSIAAFVWIVRHPLIR